jgi:4-alpha-glucanotransferase
MDQQAGAPPDDFAIKGQNWGFPTYNWQQMQTDDFTWWKRRFAQMSDYFDAFRIDHILGFFRIWSIPYHSVEGIMGRFVPAIAVHKNEFQERGIWFDHTRYTQPYITENLLNERFGEVAGFVKETFLDPTGYGQYFFKPAFDTQRKIENWFITEEVRDTNNWLRQGLYDLHSNIILFEQEGTNGTQYHFRFGMEQTSSFQSMEWDTQAKLKELYVNYFYRRQDGFWMEEAMNKLPALKASTNMLICGEDLGMVPGCVPEVMNQLGILSLEIQRMPKNPDREFFHPDDAPYLAVVTPSTHDMSTIRGWWEEDRAKTQRFFNNELGQWGDAPAFCEAWINKQIIIQHLHSPAMWSVFQLQDLLGGDDQLRRTNAADERINIPSNPKHYWRYRMHISLEQLMKEKAFNHDLKEHIKVSGRA